MEERTEKQNEILDDTMRKLCELDGENAIPVGFTVLMDYVLPGDTPNESRTRILTQDGQRHTTTVGQLTVGLAHINTPGVRS